MAENPPRCPLCQGPVALDADVLHLRRGDRSLTVDVSYWRCVAGHAAPESEEPFRFEDDALGQLNATRIQDAWRARFGEDLPARRRSGRPPVVDPRGNLVTLRLSDAEVGQLDAARGDLGRSEFIRSRIFS